MNAKNVFNPIGFCLILVVGWLTTSESHARAPEVSSPPSFERDIQPILRRNCFRCHAGENDEAGLLLDRADALVGGADGSSSLVVAGRPQESTLFLRISDEDHGDLMPLDAEPLKASDQQLIRQWIAAGAELPTDWSAGQHWAYVAPQRPEIRAIAHDTQPNEISVRLDNPIDYFIQQRLQHVGLRPSDSAAPATLARRVSLALTGLPPSPTQIEAFTRDPSRQNYEALVDELLSSATFGQHWARHWLDLARYADSNGFQADQLRDAWAYRDWVVEAFNHDKPFDEFVVEQLAGDLLPDADEQSRIATGFHRTPTCNVEAGVQPEANRVNQIFDRVNTTATVFLGTTLECAQCHDHKYDPFTQKEYYELFAYFNNTPLEVEKTAGVTYDFVGPTMDLSMDPDQEAKLDTLTSKLDSLQTEREQASSQHDWQSWREEVRASLAAGRARWITPEPMFSTTSQETFEVQPDQSVLIGGDLPGSTVYRFAYPNLSTEFPGQLLGVRIDALRDPKLPGGGPGRGDAKRTNFVLHEVELSLQRGEHAEPVPLGDAKASFSQQNYPVAGAIDGDRKTGWAIAPQFEKPHWAEFRTTKAISLENEPTLVISLDQHFGRGRVMGRPKISLLIGSELTADLTDEIVELITQDKPLSAKQRRQLEDFHLSSDPKIAQLDRQIKATQSAINRIQPPTTLVMVEQEQGRETYVMERGDYLAKGEQVSPGTPSSLHPLANDLPKNRLGLAKWITDPANPLFARVSVNRIWMEIFGRGIVTTPEDFGTQSAPPSHPELLDWLAIEFQAGDWSVKQLLKTIVMSNTFQQDSRIDDEGLAIDLDNIWLARGPRYRLPAELIRDVALSASGLLSIQPGGPPIMPYQPDGIWRAVGRNQPKWKAALNDDRYRRGLYVVWKRGAPYPSFVTFDAPDRASCTVKRARTNTPLQALVLLNDQAYAEAAIALAMRMMRESKSSDPVSIVKTGYRLATGTAPSQTAVEVLLRLYEDEYERMRTNAATAKARVAVLPAPYRDESFAETDVAAWFAVASTLLNLDATITMN